MQYKVITPVATEPLIVAEVESHLRLTFDDTYDGVDRTWLINRITAAREYCENKTGIAFATQTLEAYMYGFPCEKYIDLPKLPLQSVISVKYKDYTGVETTLSENIDYIVDTDSLVGKIVLPYAKNWPTFTPYPVNPVKIRYIVGYSDSNKIPEIIKQAMLLLIGHWYENREAVVTGSISKEVEFAVSCLLSQYRVRWWD